MEIQAFQPKVVASWSLPMNEVRILPIGDVQYGAQGCDIDRLKRHIDWGMEHDCYFIGLGDYLDVASPSNRRMLQEVALYDSVREMMDNKMEDELAKLLCILKPTVGRWLGLVTGHHRWDYADGTNTDTRLAEYLETDYLGTQGFSLLRVGEYNNRAPAQVKMLTLHGQGGGGLLGASMNKLDKYRTPYPADIVLMGHYHVAAATKRTQFDMR
ncbi:hypothetical protein LCGC14_2089760, partial [marine sediment metagenome]